MASKKKGKRLPLLGKEDGAADYKSTFTDGLDGASVVPSEYSGEADYRSTYTDENASAFSGLTGAETAIVHSELETATVHSELETASDTTRASRKKGKKRSKTNLKDDTADYKSTFTDGMNGASTTIGPSEYSGEQNRAADYQSMYTDESATVYSGLTGVDEAKTERDVAETSSETTRVSRRKRRRQSHHGQRDSDYRSTVTDGMDGAETAYTRLDGTEIDNKSAYLSERTTSAVGPIPVICRTDADDINDMAYGEGQSEFQSAGEGERAESVYSSVYLERKDGAAETLYNSVYVGEIQGPEGSFPVNDGVGSTYGAMYSGLVGEGVDYGSVYDGGAAEPVYSSVKEQTAQQPWIHDYSLPFIALLRSDDWITYTFGLLIFLLLCCAGSIIYLVIVSPISDDTEGLMAVISNLTLEFEELKQLYMLTMQETNEIENETRLIPRALNAIQQELSDLQSQNQQTEELVSRIMNVGKTPSTAIRSCASLPPYYEPGLYYISSSSAPVRVFCDNTFQCNGITGGWTKVAEIDASNHSQQCPPGLIPRITNNDLWCIAQSVDAGCTTVMFDRLGIRYAEVCGRVIGVQLGHPNAFREQDNGIDAAYVDGVSLTHGRPRQHIWTFAAARDESANNFDSKCPCLVTGNPSNTRDSPSFVGSHYFCDTGVGGNERAVAGLVYREDPLWDGAGCGSGNTCCNFNSPPWFYRQLPLSTVDDVEMRVCRDSLRKSIDIFISVVEIYVR